MTDSPTSKPGVPTMAELGDAMLPALELLPLDGNEWHNFTICVRRNKDGSIGVCRNVLTRAAVEPSTPPDKVYLVSRLRQAAKAIKEDTTGVPYWWGEVCEDAVTALSLPLPPSGAYIQPKMDDETVILRRLLGAAQTRIAELEQQPIQEALGAFADELGNLLNETNCDLMSPAGIVELVREAADRARHWRSLTKTPAQVAAELVANQRPLEGAAAKALYEAAADEARAAREPGFHAPSCASNEMPDLACDCGLADETSEIPAEQRLWHALDHIERKQEALLVALNALEEAYSHTKPNTVANGILEKALNELHRIKPATKGHVQMSGVCMPGCPACAAESEEGTHG